MNRRILGFALIVLLTCAVMGVNAQEDSAGGVITEGNPAGAENFTTFNPILCDSTACRRIGNLLFPQLFGVDLARGTIGEFGGIAERWSIDYAADPPTLDVFIRSDLVWSDGTPITAYDALFSFAVTRLYSPSQTIRSTFTSAAVMDTYQIRYTFRNPAACSSLTTLNMPIIPAHAFDPDYAGTITASDSALYDYSYVRTHAFNREPSVTASPVGMHFSDLNPTDSIRLLSDSGVAYEYINVPDRDQEVDRFLLGELNFISNPPFERRADIEAAAERGEVDLLTYPGSTSYAISLNLADPNSPQPAFDRHGNPVEQTIHPIFGDVRVRQAIQLGIDVQALIDAGVNGYGTALAANQSPGSWASNPDLAPIAYDPVAAEELLRVSGWVDEDANGVRECRGCLYADEGNPLSFTLQYPSSLARYDVIMSLIRQQLSRIGVSVDTYSTTTEDVISSARGQAYDAAFIVTVDSYPVEPDQFLMFSTAGDVPGTGVNYGSYANPDVSSLLLQARTDPTCDLEIRADLYRQAQTLIQQDQPYVWLFVVDQMLAVRAGVENFAPYPQYPFWNLDQWYVNEQ